MVHPTTVALLVLVFLIDGLSTAVVCVTATGNHGHGAQELNPVNWGPLGDFSAEAGDIMIAFVVRVLVVVFASAVAIRRMRELPLPSADDPATLPETSNAALTEAAARHEAVMTRARERVVARKKYDATHRVVIGLVFVGLTACNILVATKTLRMTFTWSPWQEIFLGMLVFWINMELLLITTTMRKLTAQMANDVFNKDVHRHPLSLRVDVGWTKCDLCSQRARQEAFHCHLCDFDLCVDCFRKSNRDHAENAATRTDKGLVDVQPVSKVRHIKQLLKIMRSFLHIVVLALVCLVASQLMKLFLPHFQGRVIDAVVRREHVEFITAVKFYGGLSLSLSVLGAVRNFCSSMTMRYANREIRSQLFIALLGRDVAFFDGNSSGALLSRITNDARAMVSPLTTLLNQVLQNIILLIGAATMCLIVCWKLALLSLTVVGPIIVVMDVYATFSKQLNRRIWDSLATANDCAGQAFGNIRTVKSFSTEREETERYASNLNEMIRRGVMDAFGSAGMYIISEGLELGSMTLILGFGGMMAINHPDELSIGDLVTFQLYANMMSNAYFGLNNTFNQFTQSAGAAERILQMLDVPGSINPDEGRALESGFDGRVQFDSIVFKYQMRPKQMVLRGLSLDCPANAVTAIVGPSGSGKTTLLHLLLRHYDPVEGAVRIDGQDLRDYSLRSVHDHLAVVSQDTQLFDKSILENITYGLPAWRKQQIIDRYRQSVAAAAPSQRQADDTSIRMDGGHSINGPADSRDDEDNDTVETARLLARQHSDREAAAAAAHRDTSVTAAAGKKKPKTKEELEKELENAALFAAAVEAAKNANADGFIRDLEEGYLTRVGERGLRLSGGQKQRIAIARAFLRQPRLLLLDEATSALDAQSEAQVQAALDRLMAEQHNQRCTVIVVAHRLSTVINANKIAVVKDGLIQEEGTHAELMQSEAGLYRAFVAQGLQHQNRVAEAAAVTAVGGPSTPVAAMSTTATAQSTAAGAA